ncbi:LPXTG cell wall anchor domain-containing protein [Streptococcus suis]|nr:LPXTG cell wall anchor domain-containing protein [Streptococcus suis]
MSKQKVVSSLLLSTVVLGGLAFYSTTTVKAESLETDVTSVSSGDVVKKPVVSDGEESDFLAEEELEDDEPLEEELNEKAEEVTEPSSPEALLQPRAMMSDSTNSDMEEIPVDDSVSEKIADTPLIQTTNADSTNYKDSVEKEKFQKSVTIDSVKLEEKQITWRVNFDTSEWSFDRHNGGIYFILPNGLKLTAIIDNNYEKANIIDKFPTNVNTSENDGGQKYRFFSKKENGEGDKNFDSQWGWSVEQAAPNEKVKNWKKENRFSEIYFIDKIQATTQLTYTLTANVTDPSQKTFPLVAVMKSFRYGNSSGTEVTSLGARMITLEKEKPLPPKEEAPKPEPEAPNPDSGIILKPLPKPEVPQTSKEEAPKEEPKPEAPQAPQAPSTPEKQPEAPKEEPKQDAPKEEPQVPSIPEEQPKAIPAPPAPSVPEEKPMEVPKPEAPKDTPEVSPKPEAPTEEPKKEDEPGQELPKPMEPKVDKPTPEVPKQEDVQPEAPKSDKAETDKPMPETKKPDMKQPKADDMPKEQKPKADEPKAEQPQMDKPQMEAPKEEPKQDAPKEELQVPSIPEEQPKETPAPVPTPEVEAPKVEEETPAPTPEVPKQEDVQPEAPKSDKVETDKPMPETKQPDMKQPKADKPEAEKAQMPRTEGMKPESKASMMPKAEASKATLPNTGGASSAIGWLGGALATLVTGLYLFKNKKEE